MIRCMETGDVLVTDTAGGDQEVLKVEVREAVVPGQIDGMCIDVLVVGVGESGTVTSRRRMAPVVRGWSPERSGGSADRRHDRCWLVQLVKLSNQAGLIGETTANPLLLI